MKFTASLIISSLVVATSADFIAVGYFRDENCTELYAATYEKAEHAGSASCAEHLQALTVESGECYVGGASGKPDNTFTRSICVPTFSVPETVDAAFRHKVDWFGSIQATSFGCKNPYGGVFYVADGSCVMKPNYADQVAEESYTWTANADGSVDWKSFAGSTDCTGTPASQHIPAFAINGIFCTPHKGFYNNPQLGRADTTKVAHKKVRML